MSIDTILDHDGHAWRVVEAGETLASFTDEQVRLSLSWKAKVYATEEIRAAADAGENGIDIEVALARIAGALDEPLAATGPDALASPALRDQLATKFSTYRAD